jgi:hypothetical protein
LFYFHYENRFSNGHQIISNGKLPKLKEINGKMTLLIGKEYKNLRPNCDQILSAKKEWGLSRSDLISDLILDLSIDSIMKLVSQIFFKTESLENCFIKRFIKLKFNI